MIPELSKIIKIKKSLDDKELIKLLDNYIIIKQNITKYFNIYSTEKYKMNKTYENIYKFECEYSIYYIRKIVNYIIYNKLNSKNIFEILTLLLVDFDLETYKLK